MIVAARLAVLDALRPLVAFEDVDVRLSWDSGSEARERVYTARSRFTQKPASLRAGRTHRNEVGIFQVVIRVEGVGDDQETTSARAVELGAAVEDWIAENRSTVAGLNWLEVRGDGDLAEMFNDAGTLAVLVYTVTYDARLT